MQNNQFKSRAAAILITMASWGAAIGAIAITETATPIALICASAVSVTVWIITEL